MLTTLNDTHLGAERSAGTTPATRQQLKLRTLAMFKCLMPKSGDLLINGDLLDTSNVALVDVLGAFDVLSEWLEANPTSKLYNSAGNHDLSKSSTTLSSFQFLGKLLSRSFPSRYVHIEQPQMTPYGYVIPHLPNQSLFDLAVERVPECDFLFVHCNIHNGFAAQSDQSLNLSLEQIAACKAKQIVCAHEHHARTLGKVTIPGNQIATSVSDWLSPGDKQFAVIKDGKLSLQTCARRDDEFIELPWDGLTEVSQPFIRVTGNVPAAQASEALAAVASYRRRSPALVITNAIKVESADGADFESAVADMTGFDVMSMLRGVLTGPEIKILEALK